MRGLIAGIFVFFTTVISAQTTKKLGEFDELKVFDRISVTLIPANENKIEITGYRSAEVEIVNNNGQLKIRMPFPKLLEGEDVLAKLYYKKLERIDGSEGAVIKGTEVMAQTAITLVTKEGAAITLNLDVKNADIKAVTGGIVTLIGKSTNLTAALGTGGILEAENLATVQTNVSIKAGGEADVRASELVKADVKAGGTITIYGKPSQINQKTTLGGTIRESSR